MQIAGYARYSPRKRQFFAEVFTDITIYETDDNTAGADYKYLNIAKFSFIDVAIYYDHLMNDFSVVNYLAKLGVYVNYGLFATEDLKIIKLTLDLTTNMNLNRALVANAQLTLHIKIIDYLVKNGADLHTKNNFLLRRYSSHPTFIKYLDYRDKKLNN